MPYRLSVGVTYRRRPTDPIALEDRMENRMENRLYASTPFGEIAYTERGRGPAALFVHGVFLNGNLWRPVIDRVSDLRRCIAVDLMAHGATRTRPGQDLSFDGQAAMLAVFCDALGIDQ